MPSLNDIHVLYAPYHVAAVAVIFNCLGQIDLIPLCVALRLCMRYPLLLINRFVVSKGAEGRDSEEVLSRTSPPTRSGYSENSDHSLAANDLSNQNLRNTMTLPWISSRSVSQSWYRAAQNIMSVISRTGNIIPVGQKRLRWQNVSHLAHNPDAILTCRF
jgi:hypothetical protein